MAKTWTVGLASLAIATDLRPPVLTWRRARVGRRGGKRARDRCELGGLLQTGKKVQCRGTSLPLLSVWRRWFRVACTGGRDWLAMNEVSSRRREKRLWSLERAEALEISLIMVTGWGCGKGLGSCGWANKRLRSPDPPFPTNLLRNLQGARGRGAPVASENRTGTSHARGCGRWRDLCQSSSVWNFHG